MDESSITQNRQSRRSNVLLSASIEAAGVVTGVKLRNLSSQGALVEGDGLPVEGSEILFRRNDLRIKARIAWVNDRFAGVAFKKELLPEEVLRNIPKPRPRMIPEFKRPGLASRELSPQERRLVESWVWSRSGSLGD